MAMRWKRADRKMDCRIADEDDFQLVSTVIVPGQPLHLRESLPPPGVELITVRELAPGEKAPATAQCNAQ